MHRFASLALALVTLAAPLSAQTAHPDLSGKWTLDPKSVDGMMAGMTMTMTVAQDAKIIKVEQAASTPMGDQKSSLSFNLDGSPSKNTMSAQGMTLELASTAAWEGDALVVKTTADMQGQSLATTERWILAADGKTLNIQRDVNAGGQNMSMKLAFTKQ